MILLFVIHTILNIFEDSMATLTNVHMRFPMNTCHGEGTSRGE